MSYSARARNLFRCALSRDQRGFLTLDFLFALILVMGMTSIFMALTLTLSVVETTQYMTFAAARVFQGAHFSQNDQTELAKAKFYQLRDSAVIKPFFLNEWYELGEPTIGDFNREYAQATDFDKNTFWGVRVLFKAPVLHMQNPMLGSSTDDGGDGLTARVQSFLSREPNTDECQAFNQQRWGAIRKLDVRYSHGNVPEKPGSTNLADNGC